MQRSARLDARIVELSCLTDDDWAGADNEDVPPGHSLGGFAQDSSFLGAGLEECGGAAKGRSVNAVITAGGLVDGDFARTLGTDVKALARLGGSTMLDRAIDAARGAGIEKLAVVGGDAVRLHCSLPRCRDRVDAVIDAAADGGANVLRALAAWEGAPLLYLTSDIPFVTAAAVQRFAERSAPAAITMPLASHDAYTRSFPNAPEHVIELGGERVANGNVFFIAADALVPVRLWATRFFAARKSKLGMARLLGPGLLLRFVVGKLTIGAIEAKAQRTLGFAVAAIRDSDPEICYDVDTLEEYMYARDRLESANA